MRSGFGRNGRHRTGNQDKNEAFSNEVLPWRLVDFDYGAGLGHGGRRAED